MRMWIFKAAEPRLLISTLDGGSGGCLERRVMRLLDSRLPWARRWRVVSAWACVAVMVAACVGGAVMGVRAQEKLRFDAVSIRATDGGQVNILTVDSQNTNVDLNPDDTFQPTAGLFRVKGTDVGGLIHFAYRLPSSQYDFVNKQLAAWARWPGGDGWTIQAKAEGNPTKDEYREMVKSMLAERFGLVTHTETREMPVYALVLDKPGKLGPALKRHSGDVPCDNVTKFQPAKGIGNIPTIDGTYPVTCDVVARVDDLPNHIRVAAGRAVTMKNIAEGLWIVSHAGPTVTLDRPVIDGTGLTGTFDVKLEFAVGLGIADGSGPVFLQAMKEQLGLRLKATTAPTEVLVIDHVNRQPTEN